MTYIEDLVRSIDGQIRDTQKTIASLEAARSRLVDGAVPRQAPPRKRTPGRARAAQSKSPQVVPAGVLGRLLAANPGLTTSALANTAGADRGQVLALLKEMERAGDARRTGARAGTRWFAITDEDKIEARAAELASRAKRAPSSRRRRAPRQ
jgi:hypothetical protein